MGKQKRNRRRSSKLNCTAIPSFKEFEESTEDIEEEDRDGALQRMYEQLQSPILEEKLSALRTLETMSCEKSQALQIAKDGTAKIVAPLLVDPEALVRAASALALRRIGENGGDEAYESLVRDDVMTPLIALLKKHYTDWRPKDVKKGRTDDERETFVEAVTLLWSLCENNDRALKPSNESRLASLLAKFLDVGIYGPAISVVAAQCLLTLSEDNPSVVAEIFHRRTDLVEILKKKKPNDDKEFGDFTNLRILTAGLLININSPKFVDITEINDDTSTLCDVTSVIAEILSIDRKNSIVEISTFSAVERKKNSRTTKTTIAETKKIIAAQQQALELLANLCSDDRDDEDSTIDDFDVDDDSDNNFMEVDDVADENLKIRTNLPIAVVEVIANSELMKHVREKTLGIEKSYFEKLGNDEDGEYVWKQIHALRCRAFLCLNNLIAALDVDTLGGVDQLYRLWLEIGTLVFKDADPKDIELLESATAAMRAALEKLREARANNFEQLTIDDVQPMLNGERRYIGNPNVRANLIRIVGNLALILVDSTKNSELVKHISTSLLDDCTEESEVWVMAETLDAIMDIFAEDETDEISREIKLVPKLRVIRVVFTNKIKQQRKTLGDNASVVSTVKTNLLRFIVYKERRLGAFE